jgi:D-alanine-D-alanine ligase
MNKPPVVLLYGLDEVSQPYEIDATNALVRVAHEALRSHGWHVETIKLEHDLVTPLKPFDPREWMVLNLCEGSPTQDFYYARVAHVLGMLDYTFTGSDHRCLDQTQFKSQMKQLLNDHHVPTPEWAVYDSPDQVDFHVYPAIIKPASEHCSLGITRKSVVLNVHEAREQVHQILSEFKGPTLVEEFLDSPEYNVTVWGCDTCDADVATDAGTISVLGISTMTYDAFDDIHDRLCTFEAKWDPASTAYQVIPAICPAPVTPELKAEIERVSIAAYRASGVRDYGRVDLRLRGQQPMVLDVNANCDVSPDGGFANAAHAAGLTYADMMERILLYAIQRRDSALLRTGARHSAEGVRHMQVPVAAR